MNYYPHIIINNNNNNNISIIIINNININNYNNNITIINIIIVSQINIINIDNNIINSIININSIITTRKKGFNRGYLVEVNITLGIHLINGGFF